MNLMPLIPLIIIAAASIALMLITAFHRDYRVTIGLSLSALALSFISLPILSPQLPLQSTPLLSIDAFAFFYMGLIFAAGFVVALLAYRYFKERAGEYDEFYILLLLSILGAAILVASRHFISFFLGLELLSISLYGLIAYTRTRELSTEAGIKYLILAAASSSFLLFGMALVYAQLGTMEFNELGKKIGSGSDLILLSGIALLIIGIGFKLGVVPFHMWTPDVYQGAPAPVSAFIATISKGSMAALLLRVFLQGNVQQQYSIFIIFALIAAASMFVGNILALFQNNVKRILAYSSIAHLGYLLVAFLASGTAAVIAVSFYLTAYFLTMLGAFGIITVMSGKARDRDMLEEYRGMVWQHPWLGAIFTAMLFSLAGIPLTAGFVGKFFLISAGVGSALWTLVIILVINSAIGLFYYLRVIIMLYARQEPAPPLPAALTLPEWITIGALAILLIWLGVFPSPFIELLNVSARMMP